MRRAHPKAECIIDGVRYRILRYEFDPREQYTVEMVLEPKKRRSKKREAKTPT